jgi:D-cysteine desulfhydrase
MPERIVVPVGSMGTAAGLLVGMCVAGDFEKIRIVGVGVTEPLLSNESKTRAAARELHQFLKSKLTPQERLRLPDCDYENSKKSFEFSGDFYQPGYGAPSDSTLEAIAMLVRTDSIHLDGTYSGKAMAWLLSDLRSRPQGAPAPRTVYWLTYNSHDLKPLIQDHPWSNPEKPWLDLPSDFHWIFEAANR